MFLRSGEAGLRRPHVVIAHSDPNYTGGVAPRLPPLWLDGRSRRRRPTARPPGRGTVGGPRCASGRTARRERLADLHKMNLGGERPSVVLVADEAACDYDFATFAGAAAS